MIEAIGIEVSKRQVVRLLIGRQGRFLDEAREVLRAGLETAAWVTVDDTGARHKAANGYYAAMLEELVDHRSGLLGISGVGSDMRHLHEAASSNPDARLAIQMFCYSVRKQAAAMIAALDGVDLIVFTGGIGEHDAEARSAICGGLSWIGVRLDGARNRSANNPINDPASRCSVRVLASQEDEQIARHTWELFPK
jgi:acetate kinase